MIWKKGRKCIYVCLIYYLFTWKSDMKNKIKKKIYSKIGRPNFVTLVTTY